MDRSPVERRFFTVLFLVVAAASAYFIRDYLLLMVSAFFLALICQPAYRHLLSLFGGRRWAALTALYVALVLIVLVPLTAVGAMVYDIVYDFTAGADTGNLGAGLSLAWAVERLNEALARIPGLDYQVSVDQAVEQIKNGGNALKAGLFLGIQGLGSGLVSLVPALFITFSLFNAVTVNYDRMRRFLLDLSPLDDEIDRLYITRIKAMSLSMARGTLIIALVQGGITGLLLWIAGVKYAAFLGLLAVIASIIPLGAGVIAIPIGIALILTGSLWQGLLQILGSLLITSNVDNVLRPKLVSKEASLHPVLVLVGLFAGLSAFGIMGAIYGPVIMIIMVTTVDVYLDYFRVKAGR